MENLASNALRYTPWRGARCRCGLERVGGWLRLAVDNDGPSLTTQELTHLFEPFYRGDAARSRATGGTGLGLAIVRTAAAAHGGICKGRRTGAEACGSGWSCGFAISLAV
ncbi:MAG: sensor histidine kinase [Flavonifractor plautii]